MRAAMQLDSKHIATQLICHRETVRKAQICAYILDEGTRSQAWEGNFLQIIAVALKP